MKSRFLLIFNLMLLGVVFLMRDRFLEKRPEPPLPVLGRLETFHLTDQDGRPVTLETFQGKPWVLNFMYAQCPSQCPAMSLKLSLLQKKFSKDIQVVSVSVDPKHDTPEALLDYSKRFGADRTRWHFLTGPKTEIDSVLRAAHLGVSGEPEAHSLRLILIDASGAIRGYYDSSDEKALGQLQKDIRRMA